MTNANSGDATSFNRSVTTLTTCGLLATTKTLVWAMTIAAMASPRRASSETTRPPAVAGCGEVPGSAGSFVVPVSATVQACQIGPLPLSSSRPAATVAAPDRRRTPPRSVSGRNRKQLAGLTVRRTRRRRWENRTRGVPGERPVLTQPGGCGPSASNQSSPPVQHPGEPGRRPGTESCSRDPSACE